MLRSIKNYNKQSAAAAALDHNETQWDLDNVKIFVKLHLSKRRENKTAGEYFPGLFFSFSAVDISYRLIFFHSVINL